MLTPHAGPSCWPLMLTPHADLLCWPLMLAPHAYLWSLYIFLFPSALAPVFTPQAHSLSLLFTADPSCDYPSFAPHVLAPIFTPVCIYLVVNP